MTRSRPAAIEPSASTTSVPAVPEFSMPPSSSSIPAATAENPAATSPTASSSKKRKVSDEQSSTVGGRVKIVFKSSTTATEQENEHSIASPLPNPPSPSAPGSSNPSWTASPDPETKPSIPSSSAALVTAADVPVFLGGTKPSASANETDETSSVVVSSNGKPKKVKTKGKGKSAKKGSKRKSKDAILEQPGLEEPTASAESLVKQDKPDSIPEQSTKMPSNTETTTPATPSTSIATSAATKTGGENADRVLVPSVASTSMARNPSINRVCHHHKSTGKGEMRMTCSNNPDCRTVWCKSCIEKNYIDLTPGKEFVEGTSFVCPVCTDRCKCSNCKKRRKENKRASSALARAANASKVEGSARRSATPMIDVVGAKVEDRSDETPTLTVSREVKALGQDANSPVPTSTDSVLAGQAVRPSTANEFQTTPQPATLNCSVLPTTSTSVSTPVPTTSSGILKIRVKPPKRPRTERGTFVPQDAAAALALEEEAILAPATAARRGRGGVRKGAGRRNTNNVLPSPSASTLAHVHTPGYVQVPMVPLNGSSHANEIGGGGPSSFFGRPPSLLASNHPGIAGAGGGPRPKRTKKVSSHYDDFAVEGVPHFEEGAEGTPTRSIATAHYGAGGTPTTGAGGREARNGVGRWGGYRKGAGGRRKTVDPLVEGHKAHAPAVTPALFPSASSVFNNASNMVGRDGQARRRPRLSGLSSASSCSELSSAGGLDEEDDDFESRYWAAKEALAERESDQRVRHWLLVPPTEPQPVLAGLERNLSEGGGEEVGFSPTNSGELEGARRRTRKEKVKWIEGPERRRRRAIALQRLKDEEDAKADASSRGIVKDDEQVYGDSTRSPKRSLSCDAIEVKATSITVDIHYTPGQSHGAGNEHSSIPAPVAMADNKTLPLPVRPASAPILSESKSTVPARSQTENEEPLYHDQPPPYESHFPPSIHSPLSTSVPRQTPAIIVSPATTAPQSPRSGFEPVSHTTSSVATPAQSALQSSEIDADLAARSADDKRLGLRLLDAIRTITGTKLAMEAIGIPPAALPVSSAPTASGPSPSTTSCEQGTSSPVKSVSEDPFSVLISQEHAELEALRREERHRLLSTALDPEKVFRAEAKGNDVSLLDQAVEWGVSGGIDIVSDEVGRKDSARDVHVAPSMFDLDSFFVSASGGSRDDLAPEWPSANSQPISATVAASVLPALGGHHEAFASPIIHPSSSAIRSEFPETPSKVLSTPHHLSAPHPSIVKDDPTHAWSTPGQIGGAATPTRGLAMELEFDFSDAMEAAVEWTSSVA